jgi:hypothetical protein
VLKYKDSTQDVTVTQESVARSQESEARRQEPVFRRKWGRGQVSKETFAPLWLSGEFSVPPCLRVSVVHSLCLRVFVVHSL